MGEPYIPDYVPGLSGQQAQPPPIGAGSGNPYVSRGEPVPKSVIQDQLGKLEKRDTTLQTLWWTQAISAGVAGAAGAAFLSGLAISVSGILVGTSIAFLVSNPVGWAVLGVGGAALLVSGVAAGVTMAKDGKLGKDVLLPNLAGMATGAMIYVVVAVVAIGLLAMGPGGGGHFGGGHFGMTNTSLTWKATPSLGVFLHSPIPEGESAPPSSDQAQIEPYRQGDNADGVHRKLHANRTNEAKVLEKLKQSLSKGQTPQPAGMRADSLRAKASAHLDQKQYAEAAQALIDLIELQGDEIDAYTLLGDTLLRLGRKDKGNQILAFGLAKAELLKAQLQKADKKSIQDVSKMQSPLEDAIQRVQQVYDRHNE